MKLRKSIPMLGMALIAGCFFTSCLKGEENAVDTKTFQTPTLNLITPKAAGEVSTVTSSTYSLQVDRINNTLTVACADLKLNALDFKFTTQPAKFTGYTNGQGFEYYTANYPSMPSQGNVGVIDNMNLWYGNSCYYDNSVEVPGYPTGNLPFAALVLGFTCDDYEVHTFPSQCWFTGTTNTNYADKDGTQVFYENKNISYRIMINAAKNKADVVIYKGKFADKAPEIPAMLLRDMDIEYGLGTYSIVGVNVIPEVVGDGGLTPYQMFMFNSFKLTTLDMELTSANIEFDVAGKYHGSFMGSYYAK